MKKITYKEIMENVFETMNEISNDEKYVAKEKWRVYNEVCDIIKNEFNNHCGVNVTMSVYDRADGNQKARNIELGAYITTEGKKLKQYIRLDTFMISISCKNVSKTWSGTMVRPISYEMSDYYKPNESLLDKTIEEIIQYRIEEKNNNIEHRIREYNNNLYDNMRAELERAIELMKKREKITYENSRYLSDRFVNNYNSAVLEYTALLNDEV